jgi:hypothetical protein
MRTIQVTTKRRANVVVAGTLFRPILGRTATTKARYDTGKYANNPLGRELTVADTIAAVWAERRRDSDGPYYALYCYSA